MAQTEPDSRTEITSTFNSRLYAGMVGSGKSVSIGHDIRTLLDAEEEYRIIDIVGVPGYGRQGLEEEFGTFYEVDDAGHPSADLYDALHAWPYVRVDAEHGSISKEKTVRRIRHVLEHASAAAKECEYPTVVVIDAHPGSVDEDVLTEFIAKARKHGVAIWFSDLDPFRSGLAERWAESGGEIVLHSAPRDPRSNRAAHLSDADREHVSVSPTGLRKGNPVLVGSPGHWEHETVFVPSVTY